MQVKMKIVIEQENAIFAKILGPFDLIHEISDYFTFEVPSANFIKKRANMHSWDGKIRLLKRHKYLYVGLIPELFRFLERRGGVQATVNLDKFYKIHNYNEEYVSSWIKNEFGLPGKFVLRDYQRAIIENGIQEKRAVFLSATSSGKSLCIYGLTKFWFDHLEEPKILIIVPSINLVTQLNSNFLEYGWKHPDLISQYYYDSPLKSVNNPIIISTWQSACKWSRNVLSQFNVVIFDEVHVAKAKEISKFLESVNNAHIRYGFTGTLDDVQIHHFIIEGLFGPKQEIINMSELIDQGFATQLKVIPVAIKHSNVKEKGFFKYADEIRYIINNERRNKFLLTLASTLEGNTMILFGRISHGKTLYDMAKRLFPDKKVYLIYGETDGELREQIRRATNSDFSGNTLIIASVQVFSVGVDIPTLKNLVLAHPTKSKIRLFQSIGRILRKHTIKEVCNFYDIGDDFRTENQYTWHHFLKRLHYYISSGLKFKVKKIEL